MSHTLHRAELRSACHLIVGVLVAALVMQTWFVMGLVVPVAVSGSSMAPTLQGPYQLYVCDACQCEFPIGLDQWSGGGRQVCPHCGGRAARAVDGIDLRGDRLFIDRTAFALRTPRRWEVVVFRNPLDARQMCVKRIVGLPGETISLAGGDVFVDGQLVRGPRDTQYDIRYGDRPQRIAVAEGDELKTQEGWRLRSGEYFVLGDNSAISDDSRSWPCGGGLDAKLLLGRPLGVR